MLRGALEGPHPAVWGDELDDESPDDTCWTEGYSDESCPSEDETCPSDPVSSRKAKWRRTGDWHQQDTLGGFFPDGGSVFPNPGGHQPGALLSSCARNATGVAFSGAAASGPWVTPAGGDRADVPYCAVPPTFYRASRPWAYPSRPANARGSPLQPSPCSLATSFSNRTVSHPSFYSYYTAISRSGPWGPPTEAGTQGHGASLPGPGDPNKVCGGQVSDGDRNEAVLPINTCDFFYTDPLMPPGHRVYNCLSNHSQQVFQNFCLNTPPPIMSVCTPLPTSKLAAPVEDGIQGSAVSGQPDVPRGKTWTKWLSLAEHDALSALLDMPHRDAAPAADSMPVRASTSQAPGCEVDRSLAGTASSQLEVGQEAREASSAGAWTRCKMEPSTLDTQLFVHGGKDPSADLPCAWKRVEESPPDMGIHAQHVHCDSRVLHTKLSLGSSSPRGYRKVDIPAGQCSQMCGVDIWALKDGPCVAPPLYQMVPHSPKTEESDKRLTATETAAVVALEPPPVEDSWAAQNLQEENSAARALLELQYVEVLEEGGPPSLGALIYPMAPAPMGDSQDGAGDVSGSVEGIDQGGFVASHVHSVVVVGGGSLAMGQKGVAKDNREPVESGRSGGFVEEPE